MIVKAFLYVKDTYPHITVVSWNVLKRFGSRLKEFKKFFKALEGEVD